MGEVCEAVGLGYKCFKSEISYIQWSEHNLTEIRGLVSDLNPPESVKFKILSSLG